MIRVLSQRAVALVRCAVGWSIVIALSASRGGAQDGMRAAWTDPSPHHARTVMVASDVGLELLDWGGSGTAMIFLAGAGQTAHSFDEFAPRFRDRFHIYGITRRGAGASSWSDSGYDAATRARDVVAVLDTLGLDRAILVGHSFAGDELSKLAVAYPSRVQALVYLEAYDYGPIAMATQPRFPPPSQALVSMTSADSASPAAVTAYIARVFGIALPEAEVRATRSFGPDGRPRPDPRPSTSQKLLSGGANSEYARITAPALAVYAGPRTPEQTYVSYPKFDNENRRVAQLIVAAGNEWRAAIQAQFRSELRGSRTAVIPGASHYIFVSHPAETEVAMRQFLSRIP